MFEGDNPFDGEVSSKSESGELPDCPDEITKVNLGDRDGNIHSRIIVWDDFDDGKWIKAPDRDFVNLYSKV